jgi:phosphoribosylanthranilate isomerase
MKCYRAGLVYSSAVESAVNIEGPEAVDLVSGIEATITGHLL